MNNTYIEWVISLIIAYITIVASLCNYGNIALMGIIILVIQSIHDEIRRCRK